MRILLTGVTGQVGGALAPTLDRLATVVAADRAVLDLAKPAAVKTVLDRLAPDLIVNPAAYTAVDRAEDEPDIAYLVNADSPAEMARWAAGRGVPLLHFSTDYVFDGSGDRPWREDDPTGPLNVYGASKLAGETAIRRAGGPHLIVRTSWVYAARGRNFLQTMSALASERAELRVVADQVGAPTSAALLAQVVADILARGDDLPARFAAARGLVHVAAAGEASWHEFASAIVEGLRARGVPLAVRRVLPVRSEDYPTKARRPRNSRLALQRLRDVFGLAPPDWRAALAAELDKLAGR
ncbi:MAG TPA: dTDP-4-dehydrorhamnose reductase [Xanthobacteraceae bacterium]